MLPIKYISIAESPLTWYKWQIQMENSLRKMVTKLLAHMGASSSSGMNLDWLAMDTPYWDTPMIWVVIISLKEAQGCSLSLWTWKLEDVSVSLPYFPSLGHSSILVTWVSFPATEPMFQAPYMTSTSAYIVFIYLHLLFCLIQCVHPKQQSCHLSVLVFSGLLYVLFLSSACLVISYHAFLI